MPFASWCRIRTTVMSQHSISKECAHSEFLPRVTRYTTGSEHQRYRLQKRSFGLVERIAASV